MMTFGGVGDDQATIDWLLRGLQLGHARLNVDGHREVVLQATEPQDIRHAPVGRRQDHPALLAVQTAVKRDQPPKSRTRDEGDPFQADHQFSAVEDIDQRQKFLRHLFEVFFLRQLLATDGGDEHIPGGVKIEEARLKLRLTHTNHPRPPLTRYHLET